VTRTVFTAALRRIVSAAAALSLASSASVWAARSSSATASSTEQPPKSAAGSTPKPIAKADAAEFDRLVSAATEARLAERWNDAITLYAKAVKLKPDYVEGYWYQGTAYYSLDDFAHCSDMFRGVVRLAPKNGGAYAFLGLCEFGLRDYDRSLQHLLQARILGVGDAKELDNVARFHAAILMTRMEQYEQALERLGEFAAEGDDNPRVIEAMGIATLRMPMLPNEYPPERREMILMAGRASYMMATRNTASAEKAFETLAARYPETPNVHYAYAICLLLEKPDKAIEEFSRELELQPGHPASMIQIAFEYENRGDTAAALPWAQKAVAAVPKDFAAHKALGQALLDSGDVAGAIKELQTGIALAPESPGLHFTLARAYQRAGRLEDAAKEREEFMRLDKLARSRRGGPQSVGGK
jgi:tetratricopeptide (TPR) repeat protein